MDGRSNLDGWGGISPLNLELIGAFWFGGELGGASVAAKSLAEVLYPKTCKLEQGPAKQEHSKSLNMSAFTETFQGQRP